MDKTLAGVLGAVGALAVTQAHAAPAPALNADPALQAASYADLLNPIPNAREVLAADPAIGTGPASMVPASMVQDVQWHHHHHHHHGWWHHHHGRWGNPYAYNYPYAYNPYGYYRGYYGYGYNPYGYYGYNPYTGY